jgi:hypothetical protein
MVWVDPKTHNLEQVVRLAKKKIVFVNSWDYVFDVPLDISADGLTLVQTKFKPNTRTVNKVAELFKQLEPGCVTVGVHIRLSDYKTYRGGIYFHPLAVYVAMMQRIEVQLKNRNSEVVFFVCSDEKFDVQTFGDLRVVSVPNAMAIDDVYALSLCQYIIGVPSSFSCWASYFGQVPLHYIYKDTDSMELADFSPAVGFNVFENGNMHVPGNLHYLKTKPTLYV